MHSKYIKTQKLWCNYFVLNDFFTHTRWFKSNNHGEFRRIVAIFCVISGKTKMRYPKSAKDSSSWFRFITRCDTIFELFNLYQKNPNYGGYRAVIDMVQEGYLTVKSHTVVRCPSGFTIFSLLVSRDDLVFHHHDQKQQ